jgi:hypothetical protein
VGLPYLSELSAGGAELIVFSEPLQDWLSSYAPTDYYMHTFLNRAV